MHDCLIANHEHKEEWYHPTAKNLKAIRKIVLTHSKEGETVLDCFMGSGTVAVACKQTKRNFIGFDLEQKYIDISEQRLSQKTLHEVIL